MHVLPFLIFPSAQVLNLDCVFMLNSDVVGILEAYLMSEKTWTFYSLPWSFKITWHKKGMDMFMSRQSTLFPKRFLLGLRIPAFGVHSAASNPHMAVFSTLLFQSASPICSHSLKLSCLGRSSMQEDSQLLPSSQSFWLFPCIPDSVLPCLQILSDIWWRQQKQDSHEPQLSSQRWFVSLSICTCVVMRDLSGRASRSSPTSVG